MDYYHPRRSNASLGLTIAAMGLLLTLACCPNNYRTTSREGNNSRLIEPEQSQLERRIYLATDSITKNYETPQRENIEVK